MDKKVKVYCDSIMHMEPSEFERFNEMTQLSKPLQNLCIEGEKLLLNFTQVIGDVWACFYKKNVKIKADLHVNQKAHEDYIRHLLSLEQYLMWHHLTEHDDLLSVFTTITIAEHLLTQLKQSEQVRSNARSRSVEERKIAMAEERIEQLTIQNDKFEQDKMKFTSRFSTNALEKAKKQMDELNKEAENQLLKSKRLLKLSLNNAIPNAMKKKESIEALSTIDGKKMNQVPLVEQLNVAEMLEKNKTIQEVAELAGRFKQIAKKKMKSSSKQTMERKYLTFGSELGRLIPLEIANYILPRSKSDFLKRYAESQTFIFDRKGKEKKGKGPIILCIDESSSMSSIKAESKAFCLAFLMIAKKQRRDFAIIPFSSDIGDITYFMKGKATNEKVMAFSSGFLGGGTNYEKPLRASLDILNKSAFNEADVIFITDGSSFLPSSFIEEFLRIKKKRKFECTSIVLTNLYSTVDLAVVNKFSDRVLEVEDLFEAEVIFSIS